MPVAHLFFKQFESFIYLARIYFGSFKFQGTFFIRLTLHGVLLGEDGVREVIVGCKVELKCKADRIFMHLHCEKIFISKNLYSYEKKMPV